MSHTPGPWTAQQGPVGSGYMQVISPDYRRECDAEHVVCELRAWRRPPPHGDARLISAAPEMLEALQELREAWCSSPDDRRQQRLYRAYVLACDALDKARPAELEVM